MLYVAEATLRTTKPLQLSGLAEKYVGKIGSWLIFFSVGGHVFLQPHRLHQRLRQDIERIFRYFPEMASCLFCPSGADERRLAGP